jgi:DNA-binding response OmpR family regulator
MSRFHSSVLLFGLDSQFFDYASFHLAAHGVQMIPALNADRLVEGVRSEAASLVLLHWDTLGELSLRSCAQLKSVPELRSTRVAIVVERLGRSIDIISAFASGADDLIEGAHNPRILWPRVEALLGRARRPTPTIQHARAPSW